MRIEIHEKDSVLGTKSGKSYLLELHFFLNITMVIDNIIKKGINYLLSDGKSTAKSIFRNGSTSNWYSWHIEYCTVWRWHTWINSFRYQTFHIAATCGRCLHFSCSFHHTICQAHQPSHVSCCCIHCLEFITCLPPVFTIRVHILTTAKDVSLSTVIPHHRHLTSLHCATVDFVMTNDYMSF